MLVFPSIAPLLAQTTFCPGTPFTPGVDATVNNQSITDLFPNPNTPTWASGAKVFVTGTLTINRSITLSNVEFIMDERAVIIVEGTGVVATANNNTTFRACAGQKMWLGITVRNGAAIHFDAVASAVFIRDAWRAITFSGSAHATASRLRNCELVNNIGGIGIANFGSTMFRPSVFAGVRILLSNPAPTSWNLPTGYTYAATPPHQGIWINNSVVDLSTNATARNTIIGYRYGIHMNGSTLSLANMSILSSAKTLADPADGTDIYATRCNLTVSGTLGTGGTGCVFNSAGNTGIWSRQTRGLFVTGALFKNPKLYGVRCTESFVASPLIDVVSNEFNFTAYPYLVSAVYIERPPSATGTAADAIRTRVRSNDIIVGSGTHQKTDAIVLVDILGKFPAKDIAEVKACTLEVKANAYFISGIRVSGLGNQYQVHEKNDLKWEPTQTPTGGPLAALKQLPAGIIAKDLIHTDHLIFDNDVLSKLNGDKSFLHRGLDLSTTPLSMFVCENRLSKTKYGIHCEAGLNQTIMKVNQMGNAFTGLLCKKGTTMPDQDRFENVWTGAYGSWGAEYVGGNHPFRIFYDGSSVIPNDVPTTFFPGTWFQQRAGSKPDCGDSIQDAFTGKERELMDGTLSPEDAAPNWDLRRELLYKMMYQPSVALGDKSAAQYLDDNETAATSPWAFAHAQTLFDQAYAVSGSLAAAIDEQAAAYAFWADSLRVLAILQDADTLTYDSTLGVLHSGAVGRLAMAADSLQNLRTQIETGIQVNLDAALDYVADLPETENYEANLKDILAIGIRYAQGDSLTEADYETLRDIAAQCPAYGGVSLRRAPHWLPHEEAVNKYLGLDWDDANCPADLISPVKDPAAMPQVQVAPNPAHAEVRVQFPSGLSGRWQLSDPLGRVVLEGHVSPPVLTLNTVGRPSGLYLFSCRFEDGSTAVAKISVCH